MLDQPDQPKAAVFKWRSAVKQGLVALRLVCALTIGAMVLTGCAISPKGVILSQAQMEERIALHPVASTQAWISPPGMQLVLQRGLGFGTEQRISLRNQTLVPGDNLIVLRTRSGINTRAALRFEEFVRRVGEIPPPFQDMVPGDLSTTNDELGTYFWTEKRFGSDTICVLGIRRIDSGMRQIPAGDDVMDVMLRNCIAGTAQEALRPLLAESVATPAVSRSGADQSRLISPLAAPTIN